MRYIYYFFFISIFLLSCNKQNSFIDKQVIEELASDFYFPSVYGSIVLFVLGENNRIYKTNINTLYVLYADDYMDDYNDFYAFVEDALNQNILITDLNSNFFYIDTVVEKDYLNLNFLNFFNMYCEKSNNNKFKYVLKRNIDPVYIPSVQYFLFYNNFKIGEDDVIGQCYVKNW